MRFRARALFLSLAPLLLSCVTEGGRDRAQIVPLAVGNTWTYADTAFWGGDSITAGISRTAITGTRIVPAAGGTDTVYVHAAVSAAGAPVDDRGTWVKNGRLGLYTRGYEEDTARIVHEVLHVQYPTRTGNRYPTRFLSFGAGPDGGRVPVFDTLEIEVADAHRVCSVPAGTFPCVQYRGWRPGGVLHATAWYAPGVGYLGSEIVRELEVNGGLRQVTFVRKLQSYTLN